MMVIVKVKNLGNCALQICAGEVITSRKVVFLAVLFKTDDAQMVSWLVLLPRYPEAGSLNQDAGKNEVTEIGILSHLEISTKTAEHTSTTH